eukprot:g62718.t1
MLQALLCVLLVGLLEAHSKPSPRLEQLFSPLAGDLPSASQMAESVSSGFLHAWRGYKAGAWGHDELLPVSNGSRDNWGGQGAMIVDALDTLMLLGLQDEVADAARHVQAMDFKKLDQDLSVFELTIRFMGGLLSAHSLSGDAMYLRKAKELADLLLPAFVTPTRFPKQLVNPARRSTRNPRWLKDNVLLADVGTLQLEWVYLAHHLGDPRYANLVLDISSRLSRAPLPQRGLYPTEVSYNNGVFSGSLISWGGQGDSFFEYLLKFWLVSGRKESQFLESYLEAVSALKQELVATVAVEYPERNVSGGFVRKSLAFVAQMVGKGKRLQVQDHLTCFLPALLALGANAFPKDPGAKGPAGLPLESRLEYNLQHQAEEDMLLADELLEGCVAAYFANSKGLGPEQLEFEPYPSPWSPQASAHHLPPTRFASERGLWNSVFNAYSRHSGYLLRPETVESLYVLYKVTGHQKYRGLMPRIIRIGRSIAASSLVSCDTGALQTSKAYFSLAPTS